MNRKFWLAGLGLATVLVCLYLGLTPKTAIATQPAVQLQTEPSLNRVVPVTTPVKFTLQALQANGKPVTDAALRIHLAAPAPTPWLTTDFPQVEGTSLLELEADAPNGMVQFQQILPIRGAYDLSVEVIPRITAAFAPFTTSLSFAIPENPVKYQNLTILLGILGVTGVGSGWLLGTKQVARPGELAPQPVRLLLSGAIVVAIAALLYVNLKAEKASAHPSEHHGATVQQSANPAVSTPTVQLKITGDQQATVGRLATQIVQVSQPANKTQAVTVAVQAITLEDNTVVFAYRGSPDHNGQLTWQEQFFDGAPHQVTAEIIEVAGKLPSEPLKVSQQIEVQGIKPPLSVRLISLTYFTAAFTLALLIGFWGRCWQGK
jgi:hypothetical protein